MNPSAAMERPSRIETKSASIVRKGNTKSSSRKAAAPDHTSQEILNSAVTDHEQIALLAYSYWEARGRQGGSPEDDWFRAEQEIRFRNNAPKNR